MQIEGKPLNLNSLAARLYSIPPSRMATFPLSVRRLLEEDMPMLIEIVRNLTKGDSDVGSADREEAPQGSRP